MRSRYGFTSERGLTAGKGVGYRKGALRANSVRSRAP